MAVGIKIGALMKNLKRHCDVVCTWLRTSEWSVSLSCSQTAVSVHTAQCGI